jgi:hypothetical protein
VVALVVSEEARGSLMLRVVRVERVERVERGAVRQLHGTWCRQWAPQATATHALFAFNIRCTRAVKFYIQIIKGHCPPQIIKGKRLRMKLDNRSPGRLQCSDIQVNWRHGKVTRSCAEYSLDWVAGRQ